MNDKNPIQVSEKLFKAIELLAEKGALSLTEISNYLDLNKSTVHRILNSLIFMNYVKQEEKTLKYGLSFKLCNLASKFLAHNDMISIIHPYLIDLANKTNETVHLVERYDTMAIYIDKVETSKNSIRLYSTIGKSIPLYCSGVGKAILAEKTKEELLEIWNKSEINKITDKTITSFNEFEIKIKEAQENGYACDIEENEIGVHCVGIYIDVPNKEYAISISAPKERLDENTIKIYGKYLLEIKEKLEKELS